MKNIMCFSLSLILLFSTNMHSHQIPHEEKLVDEIIAKTAREVKKKYNLTACGSGASMPGGPIKMIGLSFDTRKSHTKDQLRELLINIAQLMVQQVEDNEEIQKFIKNPPFTVKNAEIIIFNHDEKGLQVYDPCIGVAQISNNKLWYVTNDPNDSFKYKNEYEESYEEALKLMKTGL